MSIFTQGTKTIAKVATTTASAGFWPLLLPLITQLAQAAANSLGSNIGNTVSNAIANKLVASVIPAGQKDQLSFAEKLMRKGMENALDNAVNGNSSDYQSNIHQGHVPNSDVQKAKSVG